MKNILCFKPGVANDQTAFEPMANIYKHLEQEYKYKFTVVTDPSDTYIDTQLQTITINSGLRKKFWRVSQYTTHFPVSALLSANINNQFQTTDAVITVDPTSRVEGIIGIQKATSADVPVWFDAGRTTTNPSSGLRKTRSEVLSAALRDTTGIIITSPKVMEYFRDIYQFDAEIAQKFTVLGHPTDINRFTPQTSERIDSSDTIQILVISRLVPEKGLYYILEAVEPILSDNEDVRMTIIGEGPMRSLLEDEIRSRKLTDSITLKRKVPHDRVPSLLQSADIFVNHSVDVENWEEFFGAVNIEAMACGLPCVLSDSGSIPYVARVPDGVELVAQRDVTDLRLKIQNLLHNPSKRMKMGKLAREFVERQYSIQKIGKKYHEMLQQGM